MTTEQATQRPMWLPSVPSGALPAWEALRRALLAAEPVCAASPDLWWSHNPNDVETAIAACQRCPALIPCGAYAEAAQERLGVWAGVNRSHRVVL